jgi:hypothetical protein
MPSATLHLQALNVTLFYFSGLLGSKIREGLTRGFFPDFWKLFAQAGVKIAGRAEPAGFPEIRKPFPGIWKRLDLFEITVS